MKKDTQETVTGWWTVAIGTKTKRITKGDCKEEYIKVKQHYANNVKVDRAEP